MPLYKLEIPIEAKNESEARELKAFLQKLYEEIGLAGMRQMYLDSQKGLGKTAFNKYRKLKEAS